LNNKNEIPDIWDYASNGRFSSYVGDPVPGTQSSADLFGEEILG